MRLITTLFYNIFEFLANILLIILVEDYELRKQQRVVELKYRYSYLAARLVYVYNLY